MFAAKLPKKYDHHSTAVTVPTSPNEVLLCGGYETGTKFDTCDTFDGEKSTASPFQLNSEHDTGCMALYQNSPIMIGGGTNAYPLSNKVELLGRGFGNLSGNLNQGTRRNKL